MAKAVELPKDVKLYPLTISQQMMFLNLRFCYKKQVVNICSVVNLLDPVDENRLMQAVYLTMMRMPACSARLHKDGKEIKQYFVNRPPENIELVDLSHLDENGRETVYDEWGAEPFPNHHMDTQLYRVKIVRRENGLHSLYFCVSHVIFDAYSLMMCVRYIDDVYQALDKGTALPKEFASPLPAYEADYAYYASERYQNDLDWWRKHVAEAEPMFTTINGPGAKECKPDKRFGTTLRLWQVKAGHLNLRIPAELVNQVQEKAMAWRVSPQAFYLLAIRTYLSQVCHTDDVMFMNTVARRATMAQKRAGGTMVNAFPFITRFDNTLPFQEACTATYKVQTETYRHSNVPCEVTLDVVSKQYGLKPCTGYSTVSTTFQPYFTTTEGGLRYTFKRLPNGAATLPLYISIMPYDGTGDLWVNYEYIKNFMFPEKIEAFHNFIVAFLREGVAHPEKTLAEIGAQHIHA